jgi:chemotaxis protein MotA
MDKATVGGFISANVILVYSILIAPGAKLSAFWDMPSFFVVVLGSIAATAISFPMAAMAAIPKVIGKVVFPKTPDMKSTITTLVNLAETARRDGILALESKTADIKDPFMLLGLQMAVDGTERELVEQVLRSEVSAVAARHKTGKTLMETIGRYAPAFGMIGTLLGLIIMLGNMSDPDAIGPGMAVALITTLYGAMVSNMMTLPFADKLGYYSRREMEVREVVIQGILSIQDGDNPRVLEQKLSTMLPAAQRTKPAAAA